MNPFSVLDSDSDDDKPKAKAIAAKENSKSSDNKSKPKPTTSTTTATGGGAKKTTPAPKKEQTGIAPGEAEVIPTKEKLRDSGHGSKQKSENRSKNRAGSRNDGRDQKNNNRRSGDSEAQQKKVSKGGGGSRNWGNEEAEARAANKGGKIENDDYADDNGDYGNSGEPVAEPEPEPVTFTLEEYMAQKANERKNEDIFGAIKERAADASVDGKHIEAEEIGDYVAIGGLKENKEVKTKKEKSKQVLKIGFLSSETDQQQYNNDRDYKDKNNRDGGHKKTHRGHRGGIHNHQGGRAKFDVMDQSAFPTLG